MKSILAAILIIFLGGCAGTAIDEHIAYNQQNLGLAYLGQPLDEFSRVFGPGEQITKLQYLKPRDHYAVDGHIYDVWYLRTARYGDGETTDDEFTPYIFRNRELVAYGWQAIGGAKYTSRQVAEEKQRRDEAKALRRAASSNSSSDDIPWCNAIGMTIVCN